MADAVGQLLADPSSDLHTTAAPLVPRRASAEPRLATLAQQGRGEEQLAAIRLLGIVGTHRSIPILLELRQRAAAHDAAVSSLAAWPIPNCSGGWLLRSRTRFYGGNVGLAAHTRRRAVR